MHMTVALQLSTTRKGRLLREFQTAISATSAKDLNSWGGRTVNVLGEVTIRRGKNFGSLVGRVWNFLSKETEGLLDSIRQGKTLPHLKDRATVARDKAV